MSDQELAKELRRVEEANTATSFSLFPKAFLTV